MRIAKTIVLTMLIASCARAPQPAQPQSGQAQPPAFAIGEFLDDYGERHTVSATEWIQQPRNHFHIIRWVPAGHYLIAHNDPANPDDAGLWTRIDWVELSGMPPYQWAFCFSAYKAPSAAVAETVSVAKPEMPRTGCNGFPFTPFVERRIAVRARARARLMGVQRGPSTPV
jgi:hypothetical protein